MPDDSNWKVPLVSPALVDLKCFFIIQRNRINVNFDMMILFNQVQSIPNNRECFEAEKIHFNDTGIFNDFTIILRDEKFCVLRSGDRNNFGKIFWSDDDSCSMNTHPANGPFQYQRFFEDTGLEIISFMYLAEFFLLLQYHRCSILLLREGCFLLRAVL